MHKILDTFLNDHVGMYESDETTRRELKIIELLKTKSLSVAAGEPIHSPPPKRKLEIRDDNAESPGVSALRSTSNPQPDPSTEANILLELGQSSRRNGGLGVPSSSFPATSSDANGDSPSVSSPPWNQPPLQQLRINSNGDISAALAKTPMVDVSNASPLDEEESAQRLLDNWVNNAQIDSVGGATFGLGGIDTSSSIVPNGWSLSMEGGDAFSISRPESVDGLLALPASGQQGDASSGDWNYWDNLVEHIRASGGIA